jgi:tRNA threonylcarbamoyladenosine biosynthesis protein TsaE
MRESSASLSICIVSTILGTRTHTWLDEGGCARDAGRLAARPSLGNARVELLGPLGAGKTTFARHLLRALGVAGTVKSPTYTLLEPYGADAAHGGFAIAHCDFYRFDDPAEWEEAGFRDVFSAPGLALVEWPQKAAGLLPAPDLSIAIEPDPVRDEARVVTVVARTPRGVELLW